MKQIFKHYFKILTAAIFIGFFSGCSDWLDMKPESEIILDDFWKSESQVTSVVAGCYKSLTGDDCMSRIILWGEGRSDNVDYFDTNDENLKKMVRFDLNETNPYCTWGPFYKVINYCNSVLHYAPGVIEYDNNFTEADLHKMEAEALAIRSLCYFYLVRSFKEVPWINQPSISDQQNFNVAQSSERAVVDSIISNLKTALIYMPTTHGTVEADKGRFTKNSVMALLADIYLWDNQYENCIQMCDQIMSDRMLKLVPGESMFSGVFYQKNSSESILELQFGEKEDNQQENVIIKSYYGSNTDELAMLKFSLFLVNSSKSPFNVLSGSSYESKNDIRLKDFVNMNYTGIYPIFKYAGFSRIESYDHLTSSYYYRNNSSNWIVYRLSDIILMKAEALVQLNRNSADLQQALDLVNLTYMRSNISEESEPLKISNYPGKDDMDKLVLRERQRELLFEGKRWYDLLRKARRIEKIIPVIEFVGEKLSDGSGTTINSNSSLYSLYLPVNKAELEANPELKQNPYYAFSEK